MSYIRKSNTMLRIPWDVFHISSNIHSLSQYAFSSHAFVYIRDMNSVRLMTISSTGKEHARLETDNATFVVVMV
jgi:hypothetical protein